MRTVTIYEGYFRVLGEVLAIEGGKSMDLEGQQYIQIGEPAWKMRVERAELAREVIRLIKLHQSSNKNHLMAG